MEDFTYQIKVVKVINTQKLLATNASYINGVLTVQRAIQM